MAGLSAEIVSFITQPPLCQGLPSGNDEITASFIFPPEFVGFKGHFPDNPLLPGIVQIMLARYTAARGHDQYLYRIKRCKFLQPIKPQETVTVRVQSRGTEHEFQAQITVKDILCCTISFALQPALEAGIISVCSAGK